jgi:putative aminopeptidase FrvX
MERNYELLKEVLSIPTKTYEEDLMIDFITTWLEENNIPYYVDDFYNIYATKQTDQDIEYFPCVVAHTDPVHNIDTDRKSVV